MPANTYNGQTADVSTIAIRNFLVTHEGVSTEMAYRMTKSMFDNLPDLHAAHAAAKAMTREAAPLNTPVPLHPGAEKFYREAGLLK